MSTSPGFEHESGIPESQSSRLIPSCCRDSVTIPVTIDEHEAAGILTHRSDRLDQSGGYGEADRRLLRPHLGTCLASPELGGGR